MTEEETKTISNPTREGCNFKGWILTPEKVFETLNTYGIYTNPIGSESKKDTMERYIGGLISTEYWSDFAKGISGAEAIGTPSLELILNSYNAKYGTNYVADDTAHSKMLSGDLLYSSQLNEGTEVFNGCLLVRKV